MKPNVKTETPRKRFLLPSSQSNAVFPTDYTGADGAGSQAHLLVPQEKYFLEKSKYFIWKMSYIHERRKPDV